VSSRYWFPNFVKPAFPLRTALIVVGAVVVIEGVPLLTSRVSVLDPKTVQVCGTVEPLSLNVRFPITRSVSSVTERAALLSLLKLAVESTPSAMIPLDHLVGSLQFPSEFTVQVPLSAYANVAGNPNINRDKKRDVFIDVERRIPDYMPRLPAGHSNGRLLTTVNVPSI
jgi:hypothetical protein